MSTLLAGRGREWQDGFRSLVRHPDCIISNREQQMSYLVRGHDEAQRQRIKYAVTSCRQKDLLLPSSTNLQSPTVSAVGNTFQRFSVSEGWRLIGGLPRFLEKAIFASNFSVCSNQVQDMGKRKDCVLLSSARRPECRIE